MMRNKLLVFAVCIIMITACGDKEATALKEHLKSEYTFTSNTKKLSSGSKIQYIEMEKSINMRYAKDLDSIVNKSFDHQLEIFEEKELGVWSSYKNMFSWIFKSKQSWEDEMRVLSNRYFNPMDINQQQHALYAEYSKTIESLRQQFISSTGLPSYTNIDIPSETISLDAFSEHTRNNLVIELGGELFGWLLGFVIGQVVLLFIDLLAGPVGCLIDIVVFIIIVIISIIMTNSNDSKLIENLRSQHNQEVVYDYNEMIKKLDNNTIQFYEHL